MYFSLCIHIRYILIYKLARVYVWGRVSEWLFSGCSQFFFQARKRKKRVKSQRATGAPTARSPSSSSSSSSPSFLNSSLISHDQLKWEEVEVDASPQDRVRRCSGCISRHMRGGRGRGGWGGGVSLPPSLPLNSLLTLLPVVSLPFGSIAPSPPSTYTHTHTHTLPSPICSWLCCDMARSMNTHGATRDFNRQGRPLIQQRADQWQQGTQLVVCRPALRCPFPPPGCLFSLSLFLSPSTFTTRR